MLMTASPRRRLGLVVALLAAAAVFLATPPSFSAAAEPGDDGTDDEGGTPALRKVLEAANKGFVDARVKLDQLQEAPGSARVAAQGAGGRGMPRLLVEVGHVAAIAYRNGRLQTASMLLESSSPDAFWQRATMADTLARADGKQLRRLADSREQVLRAQGGDRRRDPGADQAARRSWPSARRTPSARCPAAGGGHRTGGFVSTNSPRGQAGAAQLRRLLAQRALLASTTRPRAAASLPRTLHALQPGQGGRLHPAHLVLPQRRRRRAPQGQGLRLRGGTRRLRQRRDRRRPHVRQQPGRVTSCATRAGSA